MHGEKTHRKAPTLGLESRSSLGGSAISSVVLAKSQPTTVLDSEHLLHFNFRLCSSAFLEKSQSQFFALHSSIFGLHGCIALFVSLFTRKFVCNSFPIFRASCGLFWRIIYRSLPLPLFAKRQ